MFLFSKIRDWLDEFWYLFFCQIALVLITGIDFTMHEVLYNYGLQFSLNWAMPYWMILHALFWSIAAVGASAYLIDRPKVSKLKTFGIFTSLVAEYHGGWLDTIFFVIERLRRGTWGKAFGNWEWSPLAQWFGYWDLNINLVLNAITFLLLIILWYFIKRRD